MAIQEFPGQLRRRRPGGNYHYVLYLNGKLWERSTGEKNFQRARKKAMELYEIAQLQKTGNGEETRLSQAIVREVARVESDVSVRQAERVSSALTNFMKWVGQDLPLEKITTDLIERFQRDRLQSKALSTVHKELCYLLRMLRNNGFEVRRPSPKKGKTKAVRAFTREELKRFFEHTPERYRCLFSMLLVTGARLAELVPSGRSTHRPLLKSEVDLEKRTVLVRTAKRRPGDEKKPRLLPLPPELIPILQEQMDRTKGPFVFSPLNNGPRDFKAILEKAGIPKENELGEHLLIHSLRHTYGTLAAESGLNQFALKEIMGHSKVSTTERYVHPTVNLIPVQLGELTGGLWQNSMAETEDGETDESCNVLQINA